MSSSTSSDANSPADTLGTSLSPEDSDSPDGAKQTDPIPDFASVPADKMKSRLDFLIKQSGIYSSIIGEKMMKQQQQMREKAVEMDKKQKAEDSKHLKTENARNTTEVLRKSSRATAAPAAPEKEVVPMKKKARQPKKGQKTANISDYYRKEELQDATTTAQALATVVEEAGETRLGEQKDLKSARQPKLITGGIMKEYQLQGLEWLVSLYENGLNGILADEMGLGKTLQTISFLAFLREKGMMGPFLVAAPVSTLSNWVEEIERFAPGLPVVLYHGTPPQREEIRRTRMRKMDADFPIVCTSYELIMNDRKYLQKYSWKFIVIDEGHRIKNLNCKLIRELKAYTSANRLLLTGTPLQNNLSELWSLLNFLLPDIFDDLESFQNWFDFSAVQQKDGHHAWLEEEKKTNVVGSLHAILKPFLLRRIKADVESSLPPKREYVLYASLSQTQKDLYGKLLDHDARGWLIDQLVGGGSKKRKFLQIGQDSPNKRSKSPGPRKRKPQISYRELDDDEYFDQLELGEGKEEEALPELSQYEQKLLDATKRIRTKKLQNLIMQLRLTCNSPYLFYWPWEDQEPDEALVTNSGKMILLDRLVPALFSRGHKVLIFSQFTRMLDIIQEWAMTLRGWPVCRIDGSIAQDDRREQIRRFNKEEEWKLFLLSTRAGGLGINLTAADTVILFDSDWNPQPDLQAQDRAHRIGQKKPVIIYRFATAGTVEQTILEKADGKRRLERIVIQKGKFKSINSAPTSGAGEEELSQLLKEDFQKVNVLSAGQQVLTDQELETLMDRSPEAYERAQKGESSASGAFRVVEIKKEMKKEEGADE